MLLWSERRWRAGYHIDRVREHPFTDLRRYQDQMAQNRPSEAPRSPSLALAIAAARPESYDKVVDELKDLADEALQAANAKDRVSAHQDLIRRLDLWAKKLEKTPLIIAEAAYTAALADPRIEKVRFLSELEGRFQPRPQFAETVLLLRLAAIDPKKWPADLIAVRRVLKITRTQELLLGGDPAALPWIINGLEAARVEQDEGETLLFCGDLEKQKRGATLLEDIERHVSEHARAMDALHDSLQLLDKAFQFLPGCAAYLESRTTPNARDDKTWQEGVDACRRLHQLLANPPKPKSGGAVYDVPALLAAIQKEAATLRERMQILNRPFQPKNLEQMIAQIDKRDATPETFLEMQALLNCPLVPADTRARLWTASVSLSRQLHARMDAADADKSHPPTSVPSYTVAEKMRLKKLDRGRAASRAALSIGLLHLGGLEEAEALKQQLELHLDAPEIVDWNILGVKLRLAWGQDVPARMKKLLDAGDLAEAACLVRVAGPLDPAVLASARLTANWRQLQAEAAWSWLASYYGRLARSFPDGSPSEDFYRRASGNYLQFAH
jgi:hypothetical protein